MDHRLNGTSYKNRITKLPQAEVNAGVFKWREGESRYNSGESSMQV